jgi:poly-gamma-glutamate synthesis protein (capsule biosynthesis protein)
VPLVAAAAALLLPAVARAGWIADAVKIVTDVRDADVVVLNAGGDVAWPNGWGGIDEVDAKQHDLFAEVRPLVEQGHLNFVNIECPMTTLEPKLKKTYPITCDPKRLAYVVDAGFNLISLANNHSMDAGPEGAADTRALMDRTTTAERPLFWAGTGDTPAAADEPRLFTVPGKKARVAFFATANTGKEALVASVWDEQLEARIGEAGKQADIVIVSVHHGPEYVHVPDASTVARYHALIDAGADVVLGHHPHVVQGMERYEHGVIFYSLGNFSFGSRTVRHHETGARLYSVLGRVTFRKGAVDAAQVFPLYANNSEPWTVAGSTLAPVHAQPQLLTGAFAEAALDEFQDFSAAIPNASPTKIVVEDGAGRLEPSSEPVVMKNPNAVRVIAPIVDKPAKAKVKAKTKAKVKKAKATPPKPKARKATTARRP